LEGGLASHPFSRPSIYPSIHPSIHLCSAASHAAELADPHDEAFVGPAGPGPPPLLPLSCRSCMHLALQTIFAMALVVVVFTQQTTSGSGLRIQDSAGYLEILFFSFQRPRPLPKTAAL